MIPTVGIMIGVYSLFRYAERVLHYASRPNKEPVDTALIVVVALALVAGCFTVMCLRDLVVAGTAPSPFDRPPY